MRRRVIWVLVALSFAVVSGIAQAAAPPAPPPPPAPASFGNCSQPPAITDAIPNEVPGGLSQANVNCFAWQEFIALNWLADASTCAADPAATAKSFGDPSNTGQVVWQTYKTIGEVFLTDAVEPPAWCRPQAAPSGGDARRPYALAKTGKFDGGPELDLSDFHEAAPRTSWLTAQSGKLTLYDIRMNEDEFDYIDTNGLYNAETQQTVAASATGLSLPDQTTGKTQTGSIELKAAWTELPDDPATHDEFLTTRALVRYPGQTKATPATMGLVGLHIIHKTQSAQQFVWATFEHVSNAPSKADVRSKKLSPPYTFFNPKCDKATDVYQCVPNPKQCPPVDPNTDPTPGCTTVDPYDAPVQVVREQAIDPQLVAPLNQAVWNLVGQQNTKSVFLNYQLVNVLWPNSSFTVAPNSTVPLFPGTPQPQPPVAVANATLETFVQGQSCLTCHVYGPVASTAQATTPIVVTQPSTTTNTTTTPSAALAADYSFILRNAKTPPGDGIGGLTIGALAAAGLALAGAAGVAARRRRQGATS